MYTRAIIIALAVFIVPCEISSGRVETRMVLNSRAQGFASVFQHDNEELEIESIRFYTRVGSRPKDYIEIKELKAEGDKRLVVPEQFDVIAIVRNNSRSSIQDSSFILLTTLDFIVAPNGPLSGADKIIKGDSWARDTLVDDVKLGLVPFIETGKAARIEFKSFNLRRTNKILSERDTIERVWAMKVTVHILNRNMVEVAHKDTVLATAH